MRHIVGSNDAENKSLIPNDGGVDQEIHALVTGPDLVVKKYHPYDNITVLEFALPEKQKHGMDITTEGNIIRIDIT